MCTIKRGSLRRLAVIACSLALWWGSAGRVAAQECTGDANSNGEVTVDELVQAVNNLLNGCGSGPLTPAGVLQNYAKMLYANYSDAEAGALRLKEAIDQFVANPAQATLDEAKAAWLSARPTYQESEIGRFYEGPVDNEENGTEGRINGWPLDESFIDYVNGSPNSGIINDVGGHPTLSKELIASLNEQGGEENISAGWHGIEFLLWGQDLSANGPGARPYTDYVTTGGTAANQARRGQYLRFAAELLVDDIRSVKEQWTPGQPNYRSEFVNLDPKIGLSRILTGIGTLSGFELSNERMATALETQDQEDEHSCFSDNTHNDHRFDQRGIMNVYFGRYGQIDGPGIEDLVKAVDPDLDARVKAAMQDALDKIYLIPVPFDQSILGNDSQPARQRIIAAVEALRAQTALIVEVADVLDVDITTTM